MPVCETAANRHRERSVAIQAVSMPREDTATVHAALDRHGAMRLRDDTELIARSQVWTSPQGRKRSMIPTYEHALIVGVGTGLSASLARLFAAEGLRVSLAARTDASMAALAAETGATAHTCDATSESDVAALFAALDGAPPVFG